MLKNLFQFRSSLATLELQNYARTETPFNPIDGPIEAHRWPSQLFPMGIDGPFELSHTFLNQKIWGFSLENQQNPVFHKGK